MKLLGSYQAMVLVELRWSFWPISGMIFLISMWMAWFWKGAGAPLFISPLS